MLEALALALLLGGAVVAGHWWLHRVDAIGRRMSVPWSVWILPCLGLLALVPVVRHHLEEDRLSAVASALSGATATVHCQSGAAEMADAGNELGYVRWGPDGVPEHSTLIKHAQCGYLQQYLHGDRSRPSLDVVTAVHVLTHESMHMAGEKDEATAECEAVQRDARTAQLLGATHAQAIALARTYWRLVYPDMRDGYRSDQCRPGGTLDEHLPDPPWA
jgi:hypothetical protein